MSYLRSLIVRFTSMHRAYQVHTLSFAVLLVGTTVALFSPGSKIALQALMLLSSFGFAIGFSIWCRPYVTKVWAHPIGKALVTTLHVLVLILATAFARFVVASSLGLPPQDFDLTVGLITIVFYIPAWSIVISVLLGSIAILWEIVGLLSVYFTRSSGRVAKCFAHMAGSLAICFFSGSVYQFAMNNEASLHPLVKWVAFFGDFQSAPLYPGIREGERIRLHENGVISVADFKNGNIEIGVRKFEQFRRPE
jgi:hypothetical protein